MHNTVIAEESRRADLGDFEVTVWELDQIRQIKMLRVAKKKSIACRRMDIIFTSLLWFFSAPNFIAIDRTNRSCNKLQSSRFFEYLLREG